ncbi:MAG: hypothetical protein QMD71_03290 [bacterium]|nr:hypothetical protein [bacterium]
MTKQENDSDVWIKGETSKFSLHEILLICLSKRRYKWKEGVVEDIADFERYKHLEVQARSLKERKYEAVTMS